MTQEELKHNSRMLVKAGVANTEMGTREYWFTADNWLNYTASITAATTVTVSELPNNTILMYAQINLYVNSDVYARLLIKTKSTDTNNSTGLGVLSGDAYFNTTQWIYGTWPIQTNGNQFYVHSVDNIQFFYIRGYKVKE